MTQLADIQAYTKLPFSGVILPEITISPDLKTAAGAKPDCSNLEFLRQLCRQGFRAKLGHLTKDQVKVYGERVKMELDTIGALGFTDYILMIQDICRFADEKEIPRGPGRGSAGSSLVCYLIGITSLDPIEHGLFFTRFLSKARAKTTVVDSVVYVDGGLVPDVDMDFCTYRRHEIMDYLAVRYPGQTSKLLTTATFTSKSLIIDVLKVYEGASQEQAHQASDLIDKKAGVPEEIEDAISDDEKKQNVRFKEWAADHEETVKIAMGLSGLNRSMGAHASALLICAYPINQLIPLQVATDDEGDQHLVSGFDMYSAQELVLKFDILALKNLSVVHDVCKRIGIDRESIDIHDPAIYQALQDFMNRYGIFQLESYSQGKVAEKIRPSNFAQLGDTLAISRPGSVDHLDQYLRYIHDGEYTPIHPVIDDILKPTGGVCLFQEQYLAMLVAIGMTPDEAEAARKVLGKKLIDKVPEVKAKITEVCQRNGQPTEVVDLLLKIAEDSGGYQFAKVHSLCYSKITAWTLYLKIKHPIVFYWANLRMARTEKANKHEKLAMIEREMRMDGYRLLPPDLLRSDLDFKIEDDKSIRYALGMIRGIDKSAQKLEAFRAVGGGGLRDEYGVVTSNKFQLFQALKNAGLNVGVSSSLIQAGCLEGFGKSRCRLVLELLTYGLLTDREKTICLTIGSHPDVNWDVLNAIVYLRDHTDENGKPLFSRKTRFDTIKKKYAQYEEIYHLNRRNEPLCNYWYERTVLGYSYSATIKDIFSKETDGLVSIRAAREMVSGEHVRLIGFVKEPFKQKTKAGNDGFKMTLVDETDEITVRFFNHKIEACERVNGRLPQESDLCLIDGEVKDASCVFADRVGLPSAKIFMKLSDLKSEGDRKSAELASPI